MHVRGWGCARSEDCIVSALVGMELRDDRPHAKWVGQLRTVVVFVFKS